jgi:hypothetical protein
MPLFKRRDGYLVTELTPLRRMLPFLLPTRTESFVLASKQIDATRTKAFLKELNTTRPPERRVTRFHLLLRSVALMFHARPQLNRFIAGGRVYQRRGVWLTSTGKVRMDDDAAEFIFKREFPVEEKLVDMVDALCDAVRDGRAGKESRAVQDVKLLLRLPAPLLRLSMAAARRLNEWNLLPYSIIESDPVFSSMFVANLGSIGLDACYHHNYEYGTCPIFMTMGRIRKMVFVSKEHEPEVRDGFEIKLTYDQRVENGFYAASVVRIIRRYFEIAPEELL